jgi:hypothetical protein
VIDAAARRRNPLPHAGDILDQIVRHNSGRLASGEPFYHLDPNFAVTVNCRSAQALFVRIGG